MCYAAGIAVHGAGEGGKSSGEEQPKCSQPLAGEQALTIDIDICLCLESLSGV